MAKGYSVNPKKDRRGLTKQEAVFADNVLDVGKEKAAEMAYPLAEPDSHRKIASEKLQKPEVLRSISRLANGKGLTRDACLTAINGGLTATKLYGKDGIEHADHAVRIKAAELGLKIHGELQNDSSPTGEMVGFGIFMLKSLRDRGLEHLADGGAE